MTEAEFQAASSAGLVVYCLTLADGDHWRAHSWEDFAFYRDLTRALRKVRPDARCRISAIARRK